MKRGIRPYGRSFLAAFLITATVAVLQTQRGFPLWHALSDGFFTAAVFLLGLGGLRFVSSRGLFDIPAYGIAALFSTHFPKYAEKEDFYDWKKRRARQEKPLRHLLVAGAVCLALSFLMLACRFV